MSQSIQESSIEQLVRQYGMPYTTALIVWGEYPAELTLSSRHTQIMRLMLGLVILIAAIVPTAYPASPSEFSYTYTVFFTLISVDVMYCLMHGVAYFELKNAMQDWLNKFKDSTNQPLYVSEFLSNALNFDLLRRVYKYRWVPLSTPITLVRLVAFVVTVWMMYKYFSLDLAVGYFIVHGGCLWLQYYAQAAVTKVLQSIEVVHATKMH